MQNDKTMNDYNGWSNWETWQILLWASNDEDLYKQTTRFVDFFAWRIGFEDKVKYFFCDMFPNGTPDMDSADEMQQVNWSEIAEHLKEWND
jgi:hypothetical protein